MQNFKSRFFVTSLWVLTFALSALSAVRAQADGEQNRQRVPGCWSDDGFFANEVWAKVAQRTCLNCHNAKGDASESEFVLHDLSIPSAKREQSLTHNRNAFARMASTTSNGKSKLLLKSIGELEHGGGDVLEKDSTSYRILNRFVRRSLGTDDDPMSHSPYEGLPLTDEDFFNGTTMITPQRLLRRVTLSLVGRLPTEQEQAAVNANGLPAVDAILDQVMQEDAFYVRLREAFNDILLTEGYDGVAEGALSYTHFHKTRLWYQARDPNRDREKDNRLKYSHPEMIAYTKLVRQYREAMRREPLELITHIVRNDLPFTEIVTADYIMVSPYTSRGYGVFDELRDSFSDVDDPFEYVPVRLKALTDDRTKKAVQESPTGFYPHAGLLSSFQYLKRYPTTETNRNRLRVRMVYEHFLGVDLLELAPRVSDAAASTAKYEIPTMQAADCVVCHKTMDPVAGLFQDYYVLDGKGIFGPRRDGWYTDMFAPGLENVPLPRDEKWRSLQWLGQSIADDPRFAVAMVNHVWYILTGRAPLSSPDDIDDHLFNFKLQSYRVQRAEFEQIAERFAQSNHNLKSVFKELVQSPFYRIDGLDMENNSPQRLAQLDGIGVARLLTPEQLERKLSAIFQIQWGRLTHPESKFEILYGGIDSKEITQRNTEPSGAMGAIQRIMSNDVACKTVAADFAKPAKDRRLFPNIEPSIVPGTSAANDAQIRQAIIHLHELLLGRFDKSDDPEVQRTFELFSGIVADSRSQEGIAPTESYACQTRRDVTPRDPDPHYTIRAWRGVITYLLRQHEFLYE